MTEEERNELKRRTKDELIYSYDLLLRRLDKYEEHNGGFGLDARPLYENAPKMLELLRKVYEKCAGDIDKGTAEKIAEIIKKIDNCNKDE